MPIHMAAQEPGPSDYRETRVSPNWLPRKGASLCLSRTYTAPDLAHRDGADAAVLMLCVQGSDVALLMFLTTTDGDDTPENAYLEKLNLFTVMPLLSRSLDRVEPWASRICRSLASSVCWGFLDELCRRNGLPLTGFMSLPDDLKAVVLEKLTDGKDLAMVECVSSQMMLLVAERDHELWKTLYNALPPRQRPGWLRRRRWLLSEAESSDEEQETLSPGWRWKGKYVKARRCPFTMSIRSILRFFYCDGIICERDLSTRPLDYWLFQHPPPEDDEEEEEQSMFTRVQRSGGHHRNLARNDCKKWHGAGAIHSPSSRYRWKHR